MSIAEISVILVIALLVIKPEDMPTIIKYIRNIRRYLRNLSSDIISKLEGEEDPEEINRYLEKILALGDKYEGEYDLEEIKKYYSKLLQLSPDITTSLGRRPARISGVMQVPRIKLDGKSKKAKK